MNEILLKLDAVKEKIIADKGNGALKLFALIRRYDLDEKWDLILSADWIEENNRESDLIYIIDLLKEFFENNLNFLLQILTLSPEEVFIQQLAQSVIQQNLEEDKDIFELKLNSGFIIGEIHFLEFDMEEEDILPEILSPTELETITPDF